MKKIRIYPPIQLKKPKAGHLLIAEPLLNDDHFTRAVILLCEHSNEGSVGFILNQPSDFELQDLLKDITGKAHVVFKGGPVQNNTLHMLHRIPNILGAGLKIANGIYWGGSFDEIGDNESIGVKGRNDLRLFLGYSGWAPGQLENEVKEGTWLIATATDEIVFDTKHEDVWKKSISLLGEKYSYLAHIPTDPQLN